MTIQETASLLNKIHGVFTRVSTSDVAIDTWNEVFEGVSYAKANRAYMTFITTEGSHDPKPGDILRIAKSFYDPIAEYEKVYCPKCHGTGIVTMIDQHKHETVAGCDCQNGAQHVGLPKINLYQPKILPSGRIEVWAAE